MKRTPLKRVAPMKVKTKLKPPKSDPLDSLFSEYIRRRAIRRVGGCERCLDEKPSNRREDGSIRPAYMELQCSHFVSRNVKSVRWDEDNAAGLCGGCHMYLEHNPHEHQAWFLSHLGEERYDLLQGRRRATGKPDRNALAIYYKTKLKEEDYGR